jgi:hypothetical protein
MIAHNSNWKTLKVLPILSLFFLFNSTCIFSQDRSTVGHLSNHLVTVKAGSLGGWVSWEKSLTRRYTTKEPWSLNMEVGYEYLNAKDTIDDKSYIYPGVSIRLETRYYFNFLSRVYLKKKTIYNGASYLSLVGMHIFRKEVDNKMLVGPMDNFIGPVIGLKRTLAKAFTFEVGAGIGLATYRNNIGANLLLDLRIGYIIYKGFRPELD